MKLQNNVSSLSLATEEKNCKILFLRSNWQLKKKIDLVFHFLSTNAKCLMGVFVRTLRKNEFWLLKCKVLNKNENIKKRKKKKQL